MESINEKIKRIRLETGVSQADVARSAGIKQSSYASIEKGDTKSISIEVGKGIARALKISFNELFDIEVSLNTNNEDQLISEIERLKSISAQQEKIIELRNELLKSYEDIYTMVYKQSFVVIHDAIYFAVDELSEIYENSDIIISVSELENKAMKKVQEQYVDFFTTMFNKIKLHP